MSAEASTSNSSNNTDPVAAAGSGSGSSESGPKKPNIDTLVLDAAPLLTQHPLRGLASKFYMPAAILAELKDKRAKEHLEFLTSSGQIDLEVREAGPLALSKVIAFAKQTGDYSVLSAPDLQVLALTYALEVERHGDLRIRGDVGGLTGQQKKDAALREAQRASQPEQQPDTSGAPVAPAKKKKSRSRNKGTSNNTSATQAEFSDKAEGKAAEAATDAAPAEASGAVEESEDNFTDAQEEDVADNDDETEENLAAQGSGTISAQAPAREQHQASTSAAAHVAEDDSDSSDGGEWITSDNIQKFKNLDLGIVQSEDSFVSTDGDQVQPKRRRGRGGGARNQGPLTVACMTADYAVQNVLLQMGLSLVSADGMRITKVKSWVLRCHACFKICKDMERKFCPSCGNATLLRTAVSTSASGAGKDGGMQVHLKKNFQYRNRGTVYSLPTPKSGTASSLKKSAAKHTVPILREDQAEWQRAVAQQNVQKRKEERALARALEKGKDTLSARYEDPDWMPDMLLAGGGRQGHAGLPALGIGRKNPNEKRRPRK
ncbi:20S-pre-rRNA D-site endonuclease nob1 [Tilletia horrida]|nr:20S-pre-rRNA D-site endonuclease nob1 [Tilletia horrida]